MIVRTRSTTAAITPTNYNFTIPGGAFNAWQTQMPMPQFPQVNLGNWFQNPFGNMNFGMNFMPAFNFQSSSSSFTPTPRRNGKYGSGDDVTVLYKGTAADLNKKLASRGVLAGKGALFMEMQNKYGVSASFLAAICILESGGTSKAAKTRNNVSGIKPPGGLKQFSSVDECIEYTAKLISGKTYIGSGRKTVNSIGERYCNAGWGPKVSEIKSGIDKAVA